MGVLLALAVGETVGEGVAVREGVAVGLLVRVAVGVDVGVLVGPVEVSPYKIPRPLVPTYMRP